MSESLRKRLDVSKHLIVLASPEAAKSEGMEFEADYWFSKPRNGEVLVIITSGEYKSWNQVREKALPPTLSSRLVAPPLFVDISSRREAMLQTPVPSGLRGQLTEDLSQVILQFYEGQNKDWGVLRGEERAQRRRLLAVLTLMSIVFFLLAMAALWFGYTARVQREIAKRRQSEAELARQNETIARQAETTARLLAETQRNRAEEQRNLAVARQLASDSRLLFQERTDRLPTAMLLAAESVERQPSVEADLVVRKALDLIPARKWEIQNAPHPSTAIASCATKEYLAVSTVVGPSRSIIRVWNTKAKKETWNRTINAITYKLVRSTDCRRLVALTNDGQLYRWDIASADGGLVLRGLEVAGPQPVILSHNLERAAIRYSNHGVKILDLNSGKQLYEHWYDDSVISAAFNISDEVIASATYSAIYVTNLDSGQSTPLQTTIGVETVTFSSAGALAATGSKGVEVWRTATEGASFILQNTEAFHQVEFSPDGRVLVAVGEVTGIHVWDIYSSSVQANIPARGKILGLQFDPTGHLLCSVEEHGVARIWDLNRRGLEQSRIPGEYDPQRISFISALGFAAADSRGAVVVWDINPHQEVFHDLRNRRVTAISFAPAHKVMAFSEMGIGVYVVDLNNGQAKLLSSNLDYWDHAQFLPNGIDILLSNYAIMEFLRITDMKIGPPLVSGGGIKAAQNCPAIPYLVSLEGKDLVLRDISNISGPPSQRISLPEKLSFVTCANDGHFLVAASSTNLYVLPLPLRMPPIRIHLSKAIVGMMGHPTLPEVITITNDGVVRATDLRSHGTTVIATPGGDGVIASFSPDGKYLAVSTKNRILQVFQGNGHLLWQLPHVLPLRSVVWTHDGEAFATVVQPRDVNKSYPNSDTDVPNAPVTDQDNAVRVFQAASGAEVARIDHDWSPEICAFSADDSLLATGGGDGLRVSFWRPYELAGYARKRLGRGLSAEEQQEFGIFGMQTIMSPRLVSSH